MSKKYCTVYGKRYLIVAEFTDTDDGHKKTNEYMEAHTDTGLLAQQDGRLVISKLTDKGIK